MMLLAVGEVSRLVLRDLTHRGAVLFTMLLSSTQVTLGLRCVLARGRIESILVLNFLRCLTLADLATCDTRVNRTASIDSRIFLQAASLVVR